MSRIIIIGAGAAIAGLVYALGWANGASHEQEHARVVENDQLRTAFEQGQALGVVRDRVVTEYVDRVKVVTERGATIIKKVPVYVDAKADAACTVNAGFVRVHDLAATAGPLPAPDIAGDAYAAGSGVALSTVAETVASNYTSCHANAEQLTQLQNLLRQYQATGGQAPP